MIYTCINHNLPGLVHILVYNYSHLSLNQQYIDILAITLMIVPAPPIHQYDVTPMMVSVLYWKKKKIFSCHKNISFFLCPQRNFGRHIVIALSVRPAFVSGPYLLYSLR